MRTPTKEKRKALVRGAKVVYGKITGKVERIADDRTVIICDSRDGSRVGAPIDAVEVAGSSPSSALSQSGVLPELRESIDLSDPEEDDEDDEDDEGDLDYDESDGEDDEDDEDDTE